MRNNLIKQKNKSPDKIGGKGEKMLKLSVNPDVSGKKLYFRIFRLPSGMLRYSIGALSLWNKIKDFNAEHYSTG